MRRLLPFLWLCFIAARAFGQPPVALAHALTHARTLPPDPARQLRYLDLTHLPPGEQADLGRVLSFHLNSLSRESDIVRPVVLAGGALLCFDLRDYGLDRLVYGRLENVDPYYHVQLETTYTNGQKSRRAAFAPWLDAAGITELSTRLNTIVPILRGDWFLYQTAVQAGRQAGYYDLLGLGKKEADFLRLIGANPAEAKRLKLEMAASIDSSVVALHNRGIRRQQALTGGHWSTEDYKTTTNKQNTVRLLAGDTEPPQGDAREEYGVLPNKLFAYFLADAQGNRQDSAPDDIASDGKSTSPDRRVQPMLSCVRCHVTGLQPIADHVRQLYSGPVQLVSPDYDRLKRLRQLYLTDLAGQLAEDNARYAAAVRACNDLTPVENARLYAAAWEQYADTPVYPVAAARELGCTEEELVQRVTDYVARGGIVDPVVAAFVRRRVPLAIRREHLEETYSLFQSVVGGH